MRCVPASGGVETRIFGDPMAFWEKQMPVGMCLRSNWGASHISDPNGELTLDAYCGENGNHLSKPIPLDRFVDYGRWYQRRAVQDLENREVRAIDFDERGFKLSLADGEEFVARRVVVAAGISSFVERRQSLLAFRRNSLSHTSEHQRFAELQRPRVAVIGAGQSGTRSVRLLARGWMRSR